MPTGTPSEEQHPLASEKIAYSIPECAKALGVSRSFLYAEMTAGRLGSVYAGKRRLIPRSSAEAWLDNLRAG